MTTTITITSDKHAITDRRQTKPRVYVWAEGETILENLQNRRSRPISQYREWALIAMAERGMKGELRWSQKAGCSCGCSPGFIVDRLAGFGWNDLHVSVKIEVQDAAVV